MDYARNRQIKYDRVYKRIGKMTPLRFLIGALLLISVFFISGMVSESFANRGMFKAAQFCMVKPWMEKYKPEEKAYIEAGVLYQNGDYAEAEKAFSSIEGLDVAEMMVSACRVKIAGQYAAQGEFGRAYEVFTTADAEMFTGKAREEYSAAAQALYEHYRGMAGCEEMAEWLRLASGA